MDFVAQRVIFSSMDIIQTQPGSRNGFLASEAEEYAKVVLYILTIKPDDRQTIRNAAR